MGSYKLIDEIIALSESKSWEMAKVEWRLHSIYFADEPETCLCGHFPIVELCELKNIKNGKFAVVGNCCVKKFLGLPTDKIFNGVKKIKSDPSSNLNGETIEHAYSQGWINSWEYEFYGDVFRKRKFSDKQHAKKRQINENILNRMSRSQGNS